MSHYDALTWTDSKCHTFEASSRARFFRDEVDARDLAARKQAAKKYTEERLQQELKKANDRRICHEMSEKRAAAELLTAATAAALPVATDNIACVSTSEEAALQGQIQNETAAAFAASAAAAAAAVMSVAATSAAPSPVVPQQQAAAASEAPTPAVPAAASEAPAPAVPQQQAAAASEAPAPAKGDLAPAAASAAKKNVRSLSPCPVNLKNEAEKEMLAREKLYDKWHKAKQSFDTLQWDRDIMRGNTDSDGKGIFAKVNISKGACVALYWGHLVDHTGLIHVRVLHHPKLHPSNFMNSPPPPLLAVHMQHDKETLT